MSWLLASQHALSLGYAPGVEGQDVTAANIAALQAVRLLLPVGCNVVAVHRWLKLLVSTNLQQ